MKRHTDNEGKRVKNKRVSIYDEHNMNRTEGETNKGTHDRCKEKALTLMLTVIAANGDPSFEL